MFLVSKYYDDDDKVMVMLSRDPGNKSETVMAGE